MWQVTGVERALPLLPAATVPAEGIPLLRAPREGQDIVADYGSTGLTLRRHPLACCVKNCGGAAWCRPRSSGNSRTANG